MEEVMAEKVTLKEFAAKLSEYTSGAGARRAIGRFSGWSEEEKAKARKLVDAKFGAAEPAPKPAKAKAPKKSGKVGRKAAAPKGRVGRPASAPDNFGEAVAELSGSPLLTAVKDEMQGKRFMAERAIHACSAVADNAVKIHEVQPSLDLTPTLAKVIELQNRALDMFMEELGGAVQLVEEKVPVKPARQPKADKGNGKLEAAVGEEAMPAPPPIVTQI
jgi:hypothetical protein